MWDEALDRSADALEEEARRRAFEGVDEPMYYKGEQIGTTKKYSDVLIMFLLSYTAEVSIFDCISGAEAAGSDVALREIRKSLLMSRRVV